MKIKELGAISKLREEFNSIPRDNVIAGMRVRNTYLEEIVAAEREMSSDSETKDKLNNDDLMER